MTRPFLPVLYFLLVQNPHCLHSSYLYCLLCKTDDEYKFWLVIPLYSLIPRLLPCRKWGESLEDLITCPVMYYAWFYAWF